MRFEKNSLSCGIITYDENNIGDDSLKDEIIEKYLIYNGNIIERESYNLCSDSTASIVYEVIRVIDGVPLFLEEHMDRLVKSSDMISMDISPLSDSIASNIKKLIEPQIDGSDASTNFLKSQYANCVKNSEIQLLDETTNDLANLIVESKKKVKALEATIAEAENRIKEKMKDTEIAYTIDRTCKWSPRSQMRVNTDLLKANFPDVYEACKRQINYRVFTVK